MRARFIGLALTAGATLYGCSDSTPSARVAGLEWSADSRVDQTQIQTTQTSCHWSEIDDGMWGACDIPDEATDITDLGSTDRCVDIDLSLFEIQDPSRGDYNCPDEEIRDSEGNVIDTQARGMEHTYSYRHPVVKTIARCTMTSQQQKTFPDDQARVRVEVVFCRDFNGAEERPDTVIVDSDPVFTVQFATGDTDLSLTATRNQWDTVPVDEQLYVKHRGDRLLCFAPAESEC